MPPKRSASSDLRRIEAFNKMAPPGTPVRVRMDSGEEKVVPVKMPADMLGGHTPVVWLEGISGAYLLDRVSRIV